jgi:hypothetical protein
MPGPIMPVPATATRRTSMVALLWEKQLSAISGQPSAAFSFQLSAISINKSATESDAPCTPAPLPLLGSL